MEKIYYKVVDRTYEQLNAFKNRYDFISQNDIINVFSSYGYEVEELEKSSSWGTGHLIYFAKIKGKKERLVFRSNSGSKGGFNTPEIVMLSEKIITDIISTLSVTTNKILNVDISRNKFPFDYQIQEEIIGVDPEKYINKNGFFLGTKKDYEKMTFELGQSIAKYSDLKFNKFGLFDEKKIIDGEIIGTSESFYEYITTNLYEHLEYLVCSNILENHEKKEIINIFYIYKDLINDCESCLVHHDLADHNITFNKKTGGLGAIFDWEAMVLGDPILDLASCPTWESHYSKREALIEGYKSIKKLPNDYEIKLNLYELRTWVWKAMFFNKMNFSKYEKTMGRNGIQKLLKYFKLNKYATFKYRKSNYI